MAAKDESISSWRRLVVFFQLGKFKIVELWLGFFVGTSLLGPRAIADGRSVAILALILVAGIEMCIRDRQYRHRAGGLPWDSVWLSEVTLWSVPLWGFLHRCAQQPEEFLYQPLWLPQVSESVALTVGFASAVLWLHFGFTRVQAFRRGQHSWGHTLYMLSLIHI